MPLSPSGPQSGNRQSFAIVQGSPKSQPTPHAAMPQSVAISSPLTMPSVQLGAAHSSVHESVLSLLPSSQSSPGSTIWLPQTATISSQMPFMHSRPWLQPLPPVQAQPSDPISQLSVVLESVDVVVSPMPTSSGPPLKHPSGAATTNGRR